MSNAAIAPLVSVIIPTHNVAPWIAETLTSVLAQDVGAMEVLVVDDHSTDETRVIVRGIAATDPRLRLIQSPLRGGGSARNHGVDEAAGRYIVFADGDDLVPLGSYAEMARSLERTGSDVVFGDFLKFSPADTWSPTRAMDAYHHAAAGIRLADAPTLILARACWNKMFRLDFWRRTGVRFPDVVRSNDIAPMVQAYTAASSIDVIPRIVYLYRERPGSGSMTAKGASDAALRSYLSQELECARMIEATGDAALSRWYRRLVWDRDTWVHVDRYAAARAAAPSTVPSDADVAVSDALAALLAAAGPPPEEMSALKASLLRLAAVGEWGAAHAAAALETGERGTDASALSCWAELLPAIPRHGDGGWLDESLVTMAIRDLQSASPMEDDREWAHAFTALERLRPADTTARVSELVLPGIETGDVIGLRRRIAATLDEMLGGQRLMLSGTSAAGGDKAQPALWAPGTRHVVRCERAQWQKIDGAEGYVWTAWFSRGSLALHREFEPVMCLSTGRLVACRSEARLPVYSALDAFIFEYAREGVVIYRRRSSLVRAVRRATFVARDRLRRVLTARRR